MLDIGWSELLIIGIVALIVVGPRDLPVLFRRMGQFMGKARGMAREFTNAMNAAADEAGVKDMANDLRKVADPKNMGLDAINKSAQDLARWDDDDAPKPKTGPKPAAAAQTSDTKPSDTKASDTKTADPQASRMTPDREEAARKIRERSAQSAAERHAKAAEAATTDTANQPAGASE